MNKKVTVARRRVRWVLATVLAISVGGCTATGTRRAEPSATPGGAQVVVTPPAPEPGIHLSLIQQGVDEGSRRVRLRVENITDRDLAVREVGLDWAGYGRTTTPSPYRVSAGATVDLPFRLPRERCGADADPRPVGVLVLKTRTLRREVDDMGVRFAQRWWRTGCALRRVRRAAELSYGGPWRVIGSGYQARLQTSLKVVRRSGAPRLTLAAAQGTVLFDLELDGTPSLAPSQPVGQLPLAVTPGRCDEHARSQASQPFTFRLNLQMDDDPQLLPVVVRPHVDQQRLLLAFLDRVCAQVND